MKTDFWTCPWCGEIAEQETQHRTICESRTCTCGAVALSAHVYDSDEIIDDAVGIFGVEIRQTSHGFNDLILADLVHNGVEVRGGSTEGPEGGLPQRRWMWFKRMSDTPGPG